MKADRAVINIAPFPTTEPFNPDYNPNKNSSIFSALPQLFAALISQSRFYSESLVDIMTGATFSRFIIAPSDSELTKDYLAAGGKSENQPPALQCASLGAFGGFFDREFRAHDYALGRRNCQKFLNDSFVLPATNPIMKEALESLTPETRQKSKTNSDAPPPAATPNPPKPSCAARPFPRPNKIPANSGCPSSPSAPTPFRRRYLTSSAPK